MAKIPQIERIDGSFPAADRNLAIIPCRLVDPLDKRDFRIGFGKIFLSLQAVGSMIDQQGESPFLVPSCSSGFLEISLQSVGQIQMDHETHIRFVDSHPERIGRHHDLNPVLDPGLLPIGTLLMIQTGMVIGSRKAHLLKGLSHLRGLPAAADINNPATAHFADDTPQTAHLVLVLNHVINQIIPFEALLENLLGPDPQFFLNIFHHIGRSGRGQSQQRHTGQHGAKFGNLQIGRPEIIAPLGNTMGFIHSQKADLHPLQMSQKHLVPASFGRHIQELVTSVNRSVQYQFGFLTGHSAIDRGSGNAPFTEIFHLILHQRNKGRYDQAYAPHGQ